MGILGKPKNRYGWARLFAWAVLAGILVWMPAAAGLRAAGDVAWMSWSEYHSFTVLEGVELALIPLLAAFMAGWLEEQEHRHHTELARHREAARAQAAQREAAVRRFRATVWDLLPDSGQDPAKIPVKTRMKLSELTRDALHELDGKGRGELVLFLYAHKLVTGEKSLVDLRGADGRGAILNSARLHGICLDGADLSNAQMSESDLRQARLFGVNLGQAYLRQTDLRDAVLSGCNLRGARLDGANLEGAKCSPDSLNRAILIDTVSPDGRKVTNENGKQYLRDKELAIIVDRL